MRRASCQIDSPPLYSCFGCKRVFSDCKDVIEELCGDESRFIGGTFCPQCEEEIGMCRTHDEARVCLDSDYTCDPKAEAILFNADCIEHDPAVLREVTR